MFNVVEPHDGSRVFNDAHIEVSDPKIASHVKPILALNTAELKLPLPFPLLRTGPAGARAAAVPLCAQTPELVTGFQAEQWVSSLGIGIYSIIVLVLRLMWSLCYVRCGQWFQQIYLNRFSSILARLCLQQARSVVIHVLAVRSLIIEKDRATSASPSPQKLGEAILPEVGKLAILLFWMGI